VLCLFVEPTLSMRIVGNDDVCITELGLVCPMLVLCLVVVLLLGYGAGIE
jgi:hypothetical protein